jgi:hypothetical protein
MKKKLEYIIAIEERAWSEALQDRILELGFTPYSGGAGSTEYGFEGEGNPVAACKTLREEFAGFNWVRHMDENYILWTTNTEKEKTDGKS